MRGQGPQALYRPAAGDKVVTTLSWLCATQGSFSFRLGAREWMGLWRILFTPTLRHAVADIGGFGEHGVTFVALVNAGYICFIGAVPALFPRRDV